MEFALPRQLHPGRGQLLVAVEDGDRPDTITAEIPLREGTPHVDFYPEGGHLVAGIENRVYFSASDARGRPLEIRGSILDGKGASVARVESGRGGLGLFSITPDTAETYRLKILSPAGISESPLLPPASADEEITITTGPGVFAAGAPLEFTVRAATRTQSTGYPTGYPDRLPLVVTARVRGLLVGQKMLVASSDQAAKARAVSIRLDDQVAGVVRLTAYDYTKSPPKVLAERLVYRRPRGLVVRVVEGKKPAGDVLLSVQNEQGQPVAAALGLTVFAGGKDKASRPGAPGARAVAAPICRTPSSGTAICRIRPRWGTLICILPMPTAERRRTVHEPQAAPCLRLYSTLCSAARVRWRQPSRATPKDFRRETPCRPPCSSIIWTNCGHSTKPR